MPTPVERLQPLADALAAGFADTVSAGCTEALHRLLPTLQYLSVAVANPAAGTHNDGLPAIVAAANCAVEGPTVLHIFDAGSSAAGLALTRGRPLKAHMPIDGREECGAASRVLSAMADLQLLATTAPRALHVLCIPFGSSAGGSAGVQVPGSCQLCGADPQASASGALLVGLEDAPDARRLALLHGLAHCLPAPMARHAAGTLELINFAVYSGFGGGGGCCCCANDAEPEEEQEEEEEGTKRGSRGGVCFHGSPRRGGHDDGGSSPPKILADRQLASPFGEEACAVAGWELPTDKGAGPSCSTQLTPPASAPATPRMPPDGSRAVFSKALLVAAASDGDGTLLRQHPLSLRFRSPLVERTYEHWMAPHFLMTDRFASLFMLLVMVFDFLAQPAQLSSRVLASSVLAASMALPLAFPFTGLLLGRRAYGVWRERFVVAFRLLTVVYACLVGIPAYQARLPRGSARLWGSFWRLTGTEALFASALGFLLPQHMHLPLQVVALGVAAKSLPRMCAQTYPGSAGCLASSVAMSAALGFLLPTVLLRRAEERSRGTFVRQLRVAAAGC